MSRTVTGRQRVRGAGRALVAAGLAVAMLTGVAGTATATPSPPLTIYEEYGWMPDGSPIRDFKRVHASDDEKYSSNGRQWARFWRDITWSEQKKAVRVRFEPYSYEYKSGLFWWSNNYRVETSTTATLTGPNGYSKSYRNFSARAGKYGAPMHAYLPFGNAGKGTYCIQTVGTVKGIGGVQQTITNWRSTCFQR